MKNPKKSAVEVDTPRKIKRALLYFMIALAVTSCSKQENSVYGTWFWGTDESRFELILSTKHLSTLSVNDFVLYENQAFTMTSVSGGAVVIESVASDRDDCFGFKFECFDALSSVITISKCHIHRNMIDEVVIASRDRNGGGLIKEPSHQDVFIDEIFSGTFYLVYKHRSSGSRRVTVDLKRVGYCHTPDVKQLYHANRTFLINGLGVPILNPTRYGMRGIDSDVLSQASDSAYFVIQMGFNQSPRAALNQKVGKVFAEDVNIEYFELLTASEIRSKLDSQVD